MRRSTARAGPFRERASIGNWHSDTRSTKLVLGVNRSVTVGHGACAVNDGLRPFADTAPILWGFGWVLLPADDKAPIIEWKGAAAAPRAARQQELLRDYANYNIGIVTGRPSGVDVVDLENASEFEMAIERFGDPAIVAESPRGGVHLYYKDAGERSANLRLPRGGWAPLDGDFQAEGRFLIVPPSFRRSGDHAGRPYRFIRGGFTPEWLARLRPIKSRSMPANDDYRDHVLHWHNGRILPQGSRKDEELFRQLMRAAPNAKNQCELVEIGMAINRRIYDPPLSASEVQATARSCWHYKVTNRLMIRGGDACPCVTEAELLVLPGEAFRLLCYLRLAHTGRRTIFALSIKAMARDRVLGLSPYHLAQAVKQLCKADKLRRVRRGGAGPHDPALYMLT
jgi:hypothetical protein